jgi:hypothetical protein
VTEPQRDRLVVRGAGLHAALAPATWRSTFRAARQRRRLRARLRQRAGLRSGELDAIYLTGGSSLRPFPAGACGRFPA